jgi:rhamnosyltransferase
MKNVIEKNEPIPKVNVLLSVHKPNTGWLDAQLKTLREQNEVHVHVLCRFDDGSTIASISGEDIKILQNNDHLGPGGSFMELIENCENTNVAFCDQDDLWSAHKLVKLYNSIKDYGGAALSFCGYAIIDASGQLIGSRAPSRKTTKFSFLFRNSIPGCTMLLNQDAVKFVKESKLYFPKNGIHDWWVALLISLTGELTPVPESLISYRLHTFNTIGISTSYVVRKKNFLNRIRKADIAINQLRKMLEYLETKDGSENSTYFLRSIVSGAYSNRFVRLANLIRFGILRSNLSEIVFTILLYLLPRKLSK